MAVSPAEMGWLDTIVNVGWPATGWFGLSFQGVWSGTTPFTDPLPVVAPAASFSLRNADFLPSAKEAAYTIVTPYRADKGIVISFKVTNIIRATLLSALLRGQPFKFSGVFTGANSGEIFNKAVAEFAADAVSAGFYPDIATAELFMFTIFLTDLLGPGSDPMLLTETHTETEPGTETTLNAFAYYNLSLVRRLITPPLTHVPFTLSVAGPPGVGPGYTWTATGRSFKKKPPFTLDTKGVPLPAWWNDYASTAIVASAGASSLSHWDIELSSLAVSVS